MTLGGCQAAKQRHTIVSVVEQLSSRGFQGTHRGTSFSLSSSLQLWSAQTHTEELKGIRFGFSPVIYHYDIQTSFTFK